VIAGAVSAPPCILISVPGITLSLPQDDGSCHHALVLPMRRSTPLACSTAGRHNPTAWYSRHPLLGNDKGAPSEVARNFYRNLRSHPLG
jgi:hypothetical protein